MYRMQIIVFVKQYFLKIKYIVENLLDSTFYFAQNLKKLSIVFGRRLETQLESYETHFCTVSFPSL